MKKIQKLLAVAGVALLTSCGAGTGSNDVEYVPFKTDKDGKWGMISMDGTVLFEEEFKDRPTVVMNDRFIVRNGNGMEELYSASEKPEKIGDEYIHICSFTDDVTPAVKKNEKITLINKNGEVKATLDKAGNKSIVTCFAFQDGFAPIITEDDKWGVIDTKGAIVVDAKYDDLYPLGDGFFMLGEMSDKNSRTVSVANSKGEIVTKLKIGEGQKYSNVNPKSSSSKYLAVCTKADGESQWGYIDMNKDIKIKPSNKIRYFGELRGENVIFRNSDGNDGVMNMKGETVLRAKYDILTWVSDDLLAAYDSERTSCELINLNGDKLTKEKYQIIRPFFDNVHAYVKIDDNSWGLINNKGEEIKDFKIDICELSFNGGDDEVNSDFVDIDAIASDINITKDGMMGYSLEMTPLQAVHRHNELLPNDSRDKISDEASEYGKDRVSSFKTRIGIISETSVHFFNMKEYDDSWNTIWSNEKPTIIETEIGGDKLTGDKSTMLYSKLLAQVKSFGKVLKENSNAAVVKVTDDCGWIIYKYQLESDRIIIGLYNYSGYKTESIDKYAKPEEITKEYGD